MNDVLLHLPGTARRQRRGDADARPSLARGPPAIDGQQDDGQDVHGDEASDLGTIGGRVLRLMQKDQ